MKKDKFQWLNRVVCGAALAFTIMGGTVRADEPGPFTVSPRVYQSNGVQTVAVAFGVPTNHILYAEKISFELTTSDSSNAAPSFALPEPVVVKDKFSGKDKKVFRTSFEATGTLTVAAGEKATLTVHYQGCDDANCFFPEELKFAISPDGTVAAIREEEDLTATSTASAAEWRKLAAGFTVSARGSGFLQEKEFLAFLDKSKSGQVESQALPSGGGFWGLVLTFGLIVLGGAALNLTPCVLPMIPINIAIIGAGAQAGSKKRGFALGATYAAGMALAYGILGLVVVLTGSKFGTLNSSPWFNLGIAVVFVVLALGMFDVLAIDLSRFQGQGSSGGASSKSKFLAAYSMGTVAALLAGACVAPVVISVLLQATTLYNQGVIVGLFLPFVLGLGMGLPWPFAGAGLSFLPKPGRWMARVKYGFGAFIVLFALYYGNIALSLFRSSGDAMVASAKGNSSVAEVSNAFAEQLSKGLAEARVSGQPVFIDFWASWCKNCSAMEHSTFEAPAVKQRLAGFHQVRLQAERPNQTPAKEVLDYFNVLGLPSFVILTPNGTTPPSSGKAPVSAALAR